MTAHPIKISTKSKRYAEQTPTRRIIGEILSKFVRYHISDCENVQEIKVNDARN